MPIRTEQFMQIEFSFSGTLSMYVTIYLFSTFFFGINVQRSMFSIQCAMLHWKSDDCYGGHILSGHYNVNSFSRSQPVFGAPN